MEQPLLNPIPIPIRRRILQRLASLRDRSIPPPPPSPAALVKNSIVYGSLTDLNSHPESQQQSPLSFPRSLSLGSFESVQRRDPIMAIPCPDEVIRANGFELLPSDSTSHDSSSHVVDVQDPEHRSRRKKLRRSVSAPAFFMGIRPTKEGAEKPQLGSACSIVKQAFIYVVVYLTLGVSIYIWRQHEFKGNITCSIVDALYFCIVTMCTIGYGDIVPSTNFTKMFTCVFILVGFGFIDILLSGLVTFVLDKQETVLIHTVDDSSHYDIAKTYIVDVAKGRMRIRMKVCLALAAVVLCIGIGTLVVHRLENLSWVDSFYLSVTSVTTVGFGDYAFKSMEGRLFAVVWLLVSTLAVARAFLYLAELRIDKRNRVIAKWILNREMTIGDLVAADLDNNGIVSKSEYVIYKLKEMGKVEEKDILEVVKQFNRLDPDNSGKITLSLLSSGH